MVVVGQACVGVHACVVCVCVGGGSLLPMGGARVPVLFASAGWCPVRGASPALRVASTSPSLSAGSPCVSRVVHVLVPAPLFAEPRSVAPVHVAIESTRFLHLLNPIVGMFRTSSGSGGHCSVPATVPLAAAPPHEPKGNSLNEWVLV